MDKVSFEVFFSIWAERQHWIVPDVHWRAVRWLSRFNDVGCLRCFRGFGKSTVMAIWVAYEVYCNPAIRILNQSESNPTAYKTSRDAMNVLRRHPLTSGILPERVGTVSQWWAVGATDSRNATMYSRGIMSNVTSARADLCINDDIEVKQNTTTPELREKMRNRLGEQIFIMVPGSRQLFIGTPHTFDSIYEEIEEQGADCLTIPCFLMRFASMAINAARPRSSCRLNL
ncbi:hypothetical protein BEE12_16105 [Pantoea agglomerans]|uniref:phage terminase large subunit n=1 Tax=Enterobacter agglomerans TaxID=549 RepID=UPI00083E06C1|nr:phage terminase large subunit [Pantoea agglomerans]AOE41240.1 hypothetical protein BEE12_16105 [Pantoea agglomerans]